MTSGMAVAGLLDFALACGYFSLLFLDCIPSESRADLYLV